MKFLDLFFRCALTLLLCAFVSGCEPPGQNSMEDEKEPHFIEGKHAVITFDFTGAIEEFVDLVVPELQRRGRFRRDYVGRTQREHLQQDA